MSAFDVNEAEEFLAALCLSGSICIELETSKTNSGLGLQRWSWKVDGVLDPVALDRLFAGAEPLLCCGFKAVVFNRRARESRGPGLPVSGGLAGAFVR